MARYRKKPIVVEAELFDGTPACASKLDLRGDFGRYYIDTLEGEMRVCQGDWVITGVAGERYPCKPGIFERTYEKVPSE